MKKRILQVVSSLNAGGAETIIMNIYKVIDREKIQFDFLVFGNTEGFYSKDIISLGGRIFSIEPVRKTGLIRYLHNLITIIKKNGPYDAVHAHIDYLSGFVALAARIAGVKKRICHSHNTEALTYIGSLNKLMLFFIRKIIIHNATDLFACGKDAAVFMFGSKGALKAEIINNSINLDLFSTPLTQCERETLRNKIGVKKGAKIIGNIGRFAEQKNHKRIIDIYAYLNSKDSNYELVLVGDGELRSEIEQYVEMLGLKEKVYFLGLRQDVYLIIKLFDVLLLPSLFEGFPVTLIEAQAAGVDCVVSDVITRDVDIGLDLVHFVSLKDDNDTWVKVIESLQNKKKKELSSCKKILAEKGFDIYRNLRKFYEAYGMNDIE